MESYVYIVVSKTREPILRASVFLSPGILWKKKQIKIAKLYRDKSPQTRPAAAKFMLTLK